MTRRGPNARSTRLTVGSVTFVRELANDQVWVRVESVITGQGLQQGGFDLLPRVGFRKKDPVPFSEDFLFAVAAAKDNGQVGMIFFQNSEGLPAIHLRHHEIQDHHGEGATRLQDLQGLNTIASEDDLATQAFKDLLSGVPDALLIIH